MPTMDADIGESKMSGKTVTMSTRIG